MGPFEELEARRVMEGAPGATLHSSIYTEAFKLSEDPSDNAQQAEEEARSNRDNALMLFRAVAEAFTSKNHLGADDGTPWGPALDSMTVRFRKGDAQEPIVVRSKEEGVESDRDEKGRILGTFVPRVAAADLMTAFTSEDPRPIQVYGVYWAFERTHYSTGTDGQVQSHTERTLFFVCANGTPHPAILPHGKEGYAFGQALNARSHLIKTELHP